MIGRVLWRQVSLNVMMTLEYRGAFFIYMVNVLGGPLVSLGVWLAVNAQGVTIGYTRSQLVTYYVMLGIVVMLTGTWGATYVADSIRTGTLSPVLLRPVSPVIDYLGNNLGEKVIKLLLLLPLVLLVALFFRDDLQLTTDPLRWLLFVASLAPAALLAFLIDFTLGLLAFWFEHVGGLIRVKNVVSAFLAGQFVPLALFPPVALPFLQVQPFRFTISFPLELLTGELAPAEVGWGFAAQLGYCALLLLAYRALWRGGLRAYAAAGA